MSVDRQVALHQRQLLTALFAMSHMQHNLRRFVRRKELHGEQRQIVLIVMSGRAHALNAFLSVINALRILVLTVPSGSPVISAISECVSPSKNAISRVLRCSSGRL